MPSSIEQLRQLNTAQEFSHTMSIIDSLYEFTPTTFSSGNTRNDVNENNGSCKLFAFAKLNEFTEPQTLALFGEYYRDVLATPEGDDHQNIRNFIKTGWAGISFDSETLTEKN